MRDAVNVRVVVINSSAVPHIGVILEGRQKEPAPLSWSKSVGGLAFALGLLLGELAYQSSLKAPGRVHHLTVGLSLESHHTARVLIGRVVLVVGIVSWYSIIGSVSYSSTML